MRKLAALALAATAVLGLSACGTVHGTVTAKNYSASTVVVTLVQSCSGKICYSVPNVTPIPESWHLTVAGQDVEVSHSEYDAAHIGDQR